MTRLLTSTLVLSAALSAALLSAPAFAAENTAPQSVAVAPSDAAKNKPAKRRSVGTAPEIVITGLREKPDSQVADNDERPNKS
jgi:hypothetical protein